MIEKIGLFYNRVDTFFLYKHSPLGNSLYLFSLCQALGQCRQTKKRASSEIATERKMAGREKGKQPVSIFTNITVCPLPRSLHEKSFLVLKDRSSGRGGGGGAEDFMGDHLIFRGAKGGNQS